MPKLESPADVLRDILNFDPDAESMEQARHALQVLHGLDLPKLWAVADSIASMYVSVLAVIDAKTAEQ